MKKFVIRNPNEMWKNIVNFLFGAGMAMRVTNSNFKLSSTFANQIAIRFTTNSETFISAFALHLSNYNLKIEEEN